MANSFIQMPPDSTGKLLDTTSLTVGGNTVQRERLNLADPTSPTAIMAVKDASTAAVAADPAGVVALSPNTSLPAGTNVLGHVIVDSFGAAVDVTDRAGRLVGIVYGSQGQQLKQTAVNFNLQVELATGGTLYDARQIRALTSADVVTAGQGGAPWSVSQSGSPWGIIGTIADGSTTETNILVVGGESNDATAQYQPIPLGAGGRSIIIEGFTGGTAVPVSGTITVSNPVTQFADNAASGATPTGTLSMGWDSANSKIRALKVDVSNQALLVNPCSGGVPAPTAAQPVFPRTAMDINLLSVHDVAVPAAAALADNIANPTTAYFGANLLGWDAVNSVWRRVQVVAGTGDVLQAITDGVNGTVAVKPASTAAVAADLALVVALSPNSNSTKVTDGTNTVAVYSDWLRNQLEVRDSRFEALFEAYESSVLGELQAIRYGIGKLIGEMLLPGLNAGGSVSVIAS
jgi:hypothetical protein